MMRDDRKNADNLLDALASSMAQLKVAEEYVAGAEAIINELEARIETLDRELGKCNERAEWYQRTAQRNRIAIKRANDRIKELEAGHVGISNQGPDGGG